MTHTHSIARPVPATLGVVFRDDRVLLVRRANPPDAGKWGFPGGKIEWGETIAAAAEREIREETGIQAVYRQTFTAVDCFDGPTDKPHQHFVLVAALCTWIAGEPAAGDDALEARWFSPEEYSRADLALSMDVLEVIRTASRL